MLDRTNLLHLVPVEEEDPHNPYDGKFINIYNMGQEFLPMNPQITPITLNHVHVLS